MTWLSRRTARHIGLLSVALLGIAPELHAATLRIKLATLVPTGSTYHKSLLALRESWRKLSNGSVDLVIYADGKLGSEADTVGLMKLNSIQGSVITVTGLSEIEKSVGSLQNIPMGFRDLAEVDYVGEKLQPTLEEILVQKGFIVLFWSDAGWVHFFSKKPVARPDDLKKLKLFCWAGNAEQVAIYKSAGMAAVPLETSDIVPGLQTGLIDATPAPPVFALKSQIDTRAPYMLQLNWAPLVGACVIRKETWEKIPEATRAELQKAAAAIGRDIQSSGRKEMEESIAEMVKRGLKVTTVNPELETEWRQAAEEAYPQIRGRIVPAEMFDRALSLIQEYRQSKGQPAK
jgi:TRAP-type C4-dicarboxylate transport system substrate-binding protein